MVNIKLARIFKGIPEAWNLAKNAKRSAKSGGRKISRFGVYHSAINHDRPLREAEYVARAGTTTPFWWGSSITPDQANYDGSVDPYKGGGAKGEYRQKTLPVKSFKPNPWGLYQVHGNVWEWVEDCWNANYDGAPGDGSARTTGDCASRVLRGGSWFGIPEFLGAAKRGGGIAGFRFSYWGFRVARTF